MRVARFSIVAAASLFFVGSMPVSTHAITAELARKCRDLMLKAHPPQRAGSRQGSFQAEREFYNNCIAHEGHIEVNPPAPAPAPASTPR